MGQPAQDRASLLWAEYELISEPLGWACPDILTNSQRAEQGVLPTKSHNWMGHPSKINSRQMGIIFYSQTSPSLT